ncbi:MAG: hypothetical protein KDE46_09935 [Caldilineaceae bacterium]|nr:hypothetical protein [Caldilineaceae bacterium]
MDKPVSIKNRIAALKSAIAAAEPQKVHEMQAVIASQGATARGADGEMLTHCPGWGEFSEWTQWFN